MSGIYFGALQAILCDKDSYLLELSRYLHLNPVRIKATKDPIDYIWSSYRGYVRGTERQKWLDTADVLRQFSRNPGQARKLYRRFVLAAIGQGHKREYYEVVDGRFLGDRKFAEDIKAKAKTRGYVRVKIKPHLFLKLACSVLGKKREEVTGAGKARERVRAREAISYVGRNFTELSVGTLAQALSVDPTCVSRSVARVEDRMANDKGLKKVVVKIVAAIENSK